MCDATPRVTMGTLPRVTEAGGGGRTHVNPYSVAYQGPSRLEVGMKKSISIGSNLAAAAVVGRCSLNPVFAHTEFDNFVHSVSDSTLACVAL